VVVVAEEREVGHIGGAAVGPVDDVVAVAPARWPVAAGEHAPTVADRERSPLRRGDRATGAADVDGHAGTVEHDGDDAGIAGQPAGRVGRDRLAGRVDGRRSRCPSEVVEPDRDGDGGAASLGAHGPADHFGQRGGPA